MANRIVNLVGLKRAGKDSLADHLVNSFGYMKFHWADTLRDVMYAFDPIIDVQVGVPVKVVRLREIVDRYGWEHAKNEYREVRRIMQTLGTDGCRAYLGQDVWINALKKKIDAVRGSVVISDGRFLDEVEAVSRWGGVNVKVTRASLDDRPRDMHRSETEVDLAKCDLEVNNDADLGDLLPEAQRINMYVVDLEKRLEW